jgi:hypothetical protein
MNFQFTPEQEEFRVAVHRFAEAVFGRSFSQRPS